MKRLLMIEDDKSLREGLEFALKPEYDTTVAGTMQEGLCYLHGARYDGVILDCNLPDGSGFTLCEEARRFTDVPILMLTARDSEMDEIKSLEIGANDYMSKPFSLSVLKVRLKKIIKTSEQAVRILSNGIAVDKNTCKVWKGEKEVPFSAMEFKLILYLIENKNTIVSKEQILRYVWDEGSKFVDENVVSVNISRLRGKLEESPSNPAYIHTVYGMGYMWKEE